MSRVGRTRQSGERFASGDLKRTPDADTIAPALLARMKILEDPNAESELGRLLIRKVISKTQHEAGIRVGGIYRQWHRYQRLRASAKSANLEQGFSGGADLAEERMTSDQAAEYEAKIKRAEDEFFALQDEIPTFPRHLRKLIEEVCVSERAINSADYGDLRAMLDKLARYFNAQRGKMATKKAKRRSERFTGIAAAAVVIEPVVAVKRPRTDPAVRALEVVMRKVWPKISEDYLRKLKDTFVALRDREQYRDKQERTRARTTPG